MSVSLRAASEFHRERLQSPQREALAVLRLVRDELELREPPHERVDGDLPFHAREGSAEAEVNAPAEGDVAVVGPGEVETIRVGELGGIAIRSADEGHHHLTLADRPAADRDVRARDARSALHGTIVAQQLLDGTPDEPGRLAEPTELAGMAQECQGPVADQVDRRLVAGDEQENARRKQLVLAQFVARLFGGDERRQEIAARGGPALR